MAFCSPKFAQGLKKALKIGKKVKKGKKEQTPRLDSNLHSIGYQDNALDHSAILFDLTL